MVHDASPIGVTATTSLDGVVVLHSETSNARKKAEKGRGDVLVIDVRRPDFIYW